jgi:Domain of unknown function (DUF5671)
MTEDSKVREFIERAKAAGLTEQSLVGILSARGWPEKEVYEALAAHYEQIVGIVIPQRGRTGTAAKDAFFHLLLFSTLATWTIGLGALAFTLIDRQFADALFSPYNQGYNMYSAAGSIASVLVAFPIYLLVSRVVLRDESQHPEKLNSPVRKWLTYMALVLTAGIMIGDLVTALTYFLRGEITPRFLAKAFVVLALSGGVFFYYFGGLRRSEESGTHGWPINDRAMAGLSTMVVAAMLAWGFSYIGAPRSQRSMRADQRRVDDLHGLSLRINNAWSANGHVLPEHLDDLHEMALADPVTHQAYEYHASDGSRYELCATFALSSGQDRQNRASDAWAHPAGRHCFALDAARLADNPRAYTPD